MTVLYTERGFLVTVDSKHHKDTARWYCNPAINAVYREFNDHGIDKKNWSWLGKTCELLARQLSATPRFVEFQFTSDRPVPFRATDFMMDTLNYLTTGRRKLSIENWFDLLEVNPTVMTPVANSIVNRATDDYCTLIRMSSVDLVCRWLQQPDGLKDLITSCMLIFGDSTKAETE